MSDTFKMKSISSTSRVVKNAPIALASVASVPRASNSTFMGEARMNLATEV